MLKVDHKIFDDDASIDDDDDDDDGDDDDDDGDDGDDGDNGRGEEEKEEARAISSTVIGRWARKILPPSVHERSASALFVKPSRSPGPTGPPPSVAMMT